MKKTINFSWPATLSDFSQDNSNENFTRGKLKVFYKGETADHRFFSDNFSDELVKSLPYTPVVGHYDIEKEDFVGHATQQDIYGIVDPCTPSTFETDEDGHEWCVCDVVLYTERPDQVGDIAKKILGHKQSLELDPRTVKYTINYDSRKHFKNIEFTAGTFVGVSVLGESETPAFTGSEFFTVNDAQFKQKMEILKNYCEGKTDQHGETEMNLTEFMKLSWGDISLKVQEAIDAEYSNEYYTYCVDYFEDCVIARFYSYFDGTVKLNRVYYTVDENGVVTLGDVNEVHIVYEDVPASTGETGEFSADGSTDFENNEFGENSFEVNAENDLTNAEEQPVVEEIQEPVVEETITINEPNEVFEEVTISGTELENAQVAATEGKSAANETIQEEEKSGTASFTQSERAELEGLKREKKLNLLNDYKEFLDDAEFVDFTNRIDEFTEDKLELELLKKYKARQADSPKQMAPFAMFQEPQTNETDNDKLASYIRRQLNK